MAITGNQKAYTYALSNVARSGATRSGYVGGGAFIAVGGLPATGDVKLGTLEIVDELNETPNTCRFRIIGPTTITTGQEVIITLGSQNGLRLFAGHVLAAQQSYWEKPVNVRTDVQAVDYTWQFGFPKVTKRYANLSASAIVQDLIATYAAANGFTGLHVAAGLPTIPEITFTNEDLGEALSRTANRIGAYWYVDYFKDVHFFFTDTAQTPSALVPTHPSLDNVTRDTDRSQALTRVYVEGRGSRLLSAVTIGDTILPLEAVDMFQALPDVFLKASYQGAEGGAQHLTFAGVVSGGGGTLVGPGIGPSTAVTLATQTGGSITPGVHGYAVTFVTAAGESLPSPIATITAGQQLANPPVAPTGGTPPDNYFGNLLENGFYQIKYAYATDTGVPPANVTLASPPSAVMRANNSGGAANNAAIETAIPCSASPTVKYVFVYRTVAGGATFYRGSSAPNVPGTYVNLGSTPSDATIVGQGPEPATNTTATQGTVLLSAIPIGAAAVTQRKVYRTAANAAQLKLLATIANNTATTYSDTAADAALGVNVPSTDTSALQQPDGQVLAGSSVLPVAGAGPFESLGGWAIIGNGAQVIRYTSTTLIAGYLTGIPISGIGAITATIAYNSTVTAAPMLTGIPASGGRSLVQALSAGDEIYLVVQVDDATRAAQLAAAVGGTGLREEWVQDRRLSIGEARARGNATLAERALDQIRVSYTSRDLLTRSGLDIVCNLPAPTNLVGTFKIQHVVINNFRPYPTQYPTFTVQASSSRFSFEDLLRLATRDVAR